MADKLVPLRDDMGVVCKFVDLGTGAWAQQIVVASTAGAAGYPAGATPVAATANGANTLATATLPGVAGKTTYITGMQVTGAGATGAALGGVTLSGVLGGSAPFFFSIPAGTTSAIAPLLVSFQPPLAASAPNTAIAAALNAFGAGNTTAQVSVQGFQA